MAARFRVFHPRMVIQKDKKRQQQLVEAENLKQGRKLADVCAGSSEYAVQSGVQVGGQSRTRRRRTGQKSPITPFSLALSVDALNGLTI